MSEQVRAQGWGDDRMEIKGSVCCCEGIGRVYWVGSSQSQASGALCWVGMRGSW